jgi:hypothetical protein
MPSPFSSQMEQPEPPPNQAQSLSASLKPASQRSLGAGSPWFWHLLPPSSLLLWPILFFVAPISLLVGENLLSPLLDQALGFMSTGEVALPWVFLLKLLTFLVLAILGLGQLFHRLQVSYYSQWSLSYARPHHLHVDYTPDHRESMAALLRWNGFRLLRAGLPPIGGSFLAFALVLGALYLFNSSLSSQAWFMPLFITSSLFLISLVILATGCLTLNSVWMNITTLYGLCASITEPDLPVLQVYDRVNRIVFSTPLTFFAIPFYLLCNALLLAFSVWLLLTFNVEDITSGGFNWGLVLGLEGALACLYVAMHALRWFAYHQALIQYYQKLPAFMKNQFNPPPVTKALLYS